MYHEPKQFRKKPVVIEAMQWTGDNWPELLCWHEDKAIGTELMSIEEGVCKITTLEGVMTADYGDWIICGVNSEFYPCKPDIFDKTYEPEAS